MTMVDTIGRIQQIQSALTQLTAPPEAAPPAPAAATTETTGTPATAEAFAQALTAATEPEVPVLSQITNPPASAAIAETPTAVAPSTSSAPSTSAGIDFAAASEKYLGLPYIWGGNDPSAGLDCSSFVQNVYKDLGYELPRTTWDQINQGTAVASMADAKPGDLLFSFDGGHVSMYLGNGKAVDAPQPGQTIQVRDAWENDSNITAIRRIIPDAEPVAASAASTGMTDLVTAAARSSLLSGAAS